MIETVNFTRARENLREHLDSVCEKGSPLRITRTNGSSCIILPEESYRSLLELTCLLLEKSFNSGESLTLHIDDTLQKERFYSMHLTPR